MMVVQDVDLTIEHIFSIFIKPLQVVLLRLSHLLLMLKLPLHLFQADLLNLVLKLLAYF